MPGAINKNGHLPYQLNIYNQRLQIKKQESRSVHKHNPAGPDNARCNSPLRLTLKPPSKERNHKPRQRNPNRIVFYPRGERWACGRAGGITGHGRGAKVGVTQVVLDGVSPTVHFSSNEAQVRERKGCVREMKGRCCEGVQGQGGRSWKASPKGGAKGEEGGGGRRGSSLMCCRTTVIGEGVAGESKMLRVVIIGVLRCVDA